MQNFLWPPMSERLSKARACGCPRYSSLHARASGCSSTPMGQTAVVLDKDFRRRIVYGSDEQATRGLATLLDYPEEFIEKLFARVK